MTNAHEHISGRPRPYVSRKWLYRGRRRAKKRSLTVAELKAQLNRQLCEAHGKSGITTWHPTLDGRHICFHGAESPFLMDYAPLEGE